MIDRRVETFSVVVLTVQGSRALRCCFVFDSLFSVLSLDIELSNQHVPTRIDVSLDALNMVRIRRVRNSLPTWAFQSFVSRWGRRVWKRINITLDIAGEDCHQAECVYDVRTNIAC